jgi:hypothetical protein
LRLQLHNQTHRAACRPVLLQEVLFAVFGCQPLPQDCNCSRSLPSPGEKVANAHSSQHSRIHLKKSSKGQLAPYLNCELINIHIGARICRAMTTARRYQVPSSLPGSNPAWVAVSGLT